MTRSTATANRPATVHSAQACSESRKRTVCTTSSGRHCRCARVFLKEDKLRPFSTEQANQQSKIAALYSEAQKNAQAAMHGGANKAAPFLRKATAEAALGAHLTSMKTANDGLAVTPNDPKLTDSRPATRGPYRIAITATKSSSAPSVLAADAVVQEVVVEQKVHKERALQEMPRMETN